MFQNKTKNIKLLFSFVFFILLILGLYYYISSHIPLAQSIEPKLVLSEETWDFEEVLQGSKVTHFFNVKNEGEEDLIIKKIQASCSCLQVNYDENIKVIKKKQSLLLEVIYSSLGYIGDVSKNVYIFSNDPVNSKQKIIINAHVYIGKKPSIELEEQDYYIGAIKQGEKYVFEVIIKNIGEKDLIINKIESFPHIKHDAELPLAVIPSTIKKIRFVFNSTSLESGEVREAVWLYSNDPKREKIPLRISGDIE